MTGPTPNPFAATTAINATVNRVHLFFNAVPDTVVAGLIPRMKLYRAGAFVPISSVTTDQDHVRVSHIADAGNVTYVGYSGPLADPVTWIPMLTPVPGLVRAGRFYMPVPLP